MQFLDFDHLLMAPTEYEIIQRLLSAQSIGGNIDAVIEGVIQALGPHGGRLFLMNSVEEFAPDDPNRRAIAEYMHKPFALEDISFLTIDQVWKTFLGCRSNHS